MDSSGKPSSTLCFGVFEANLAAGELRESGVRVKLEQQPFQVLALLLKKPGRDRHPRRVLDEATRPRYIERLSKRGCRFIFFRNSRKVGLTGERFSLTW